MAYSEAHFKGKCQSNVSEVGTANNARQKTTFTGLALVFIYLCVYYLLRNGCLYEFLPVQNQVCVKHVFIRGEFKK